MAIVRHSSTYVPQPAATTFAFPSLWFLFYCVQHRRRMENRMNLTFSFKSTKAKQLYAARNWINSVPQPAATTFTFPSVFYVVQAEIKKKLKGGVERAVQSPDYKNIFSAVIDTYSNNTILRNFAEVSTTFYQLNGTVSRDFRQFFCSTPWAHLNRQKQFHELFRFREAIRL